MSLLFFAYGVSLYNAFYLTGLEPMSFGVSPDTLPTTATGIVVIIFNSIQTHKC